jgi:hypothetical protein
MSEKGSVVIDRGLLQVATFMRLNVRNIEHFPPEAWHSLQTPTIKNFFSKGGVRFDVSLDIPIDKMVMFEKEEEEEEKKAIMVAVMVVVVGVV